MKGILNMIESGRIRPLTGHDNRWWWEQVAGGDVILEINHHAVTSADEAVKLSSDGTKKKTLLKLWSHGGMIYTVVDETTPGNS